MNWMRMVTKVRRRIEHSCLNPQQHEKFKVFFIAWIILLLFIKCLWRQCYWHLSEEFCSVFFFVCSFFDCSASKWMCLNEVVTEKMKGNNSQFLQIVTFFFSSANKSQIDILNFSTSGTQQTFIGWSNECNVVVSSFSLKRSGMNDVFMANIHAEDHKVGYIVPAVSYMRNCMVKSKMVVG